MLALMVELNWDFISVIWSDDKIGQQSFQLFEQLSKTFYVCIGYNATTANSSKFENQIQTKGVVYLGSEQIGKHENSNGLIR